MEIEVKMSSADGVTLKTAGKWCNRNVRVELDDESLVALAPENVRKGVSVLGVVGTMEEGRPPLPAPTIAYQDGSASTIVITDTSGVADMYFIYVDGVCKGYSERAEVNLNVYTTGMANGTYAVSVIAVDTSAGALSEVSESIFFVRNTYDLTVTVDYTYTYQDYYDGEPSGYTQKDGVEKVSFVIGESYTTSEVTTITASGGESEGSFVGEVSISGPYADCVNAEVDSWFDEYGTATYMPRVSKFVISGIPADSFVEIYLHGQGYVHDYSTESVKNAVNCEGTVTSTDEDDDGIPDYSVYKIYNFSSANGNAASATLYYSCYVDNYM